MMSCVFSLYSYSIEAASSAVDHYFQVISLRDCILFRVFQSRAEISYGRNLELSISHEIFHILDFICMDTCTNSIVPYMCPYI